MKYYNILIVIIVIAIAALLLTSCSTQKRWADKGIRKGWLDTATQQLHGVVIKTDTVTITAEVDTFFQKVFVEVKTPCDEKGNLTPKAKKEIVDKVKKELVPAIQTATFIGAQDITLKNGGHVKLWYDTTLKQINYDLTLPGQTLMCPEPTFKEACSKVWWLLLLAPVLGILVFLIFLYLVTRLKK